MPKEVLLRSDEIVTWSSGPYMYVTNLAGDLTSQQVLGIPYKSGNNKTLFVMLYAFNVMCTHRGEEISADYL
jgi:hypothetical protein